MIVDDYFKPCQVLVVAHSNIMFDGKALPDGDEWICCLVKDSLYKAFFIRIIDPKVHYSKCDVLHLSSIMSPVTKPCFDMYHLEIGKRACWREENNQAV